MKKSFITLVCLLLFSFSIPGFATDYYFDATGGNDGNAGTSPEYAWKTVSKFNSSNFSPGDAIYFKRGETFTGGIWYMDDSGTSENWITLSAYGTGDPPVFDAESSYDTCLAIRGKYQATTGAQYIMVEHLDLTGSSGGMGAANIYGNESGTNYGPCSYIYYYDCRAYDNNGHGFKAAQTVASLDRTVTYVTYDNCQAFNNQRSTYYSACGFQISNGTGNIEVKNCAAFNNNFGVHFGSTNTGSLHNSIIYDNSVDINGGEVCITDANNDVGADDIEIYNNVIYNQ